MILTSLGDLLTGKNLSEVMLALDIVKMVLVIAIVFLAHKYYTKNRWALLLITLAGLYLFFF